MLSLRSHFLFFAIPAMVARGQDPAPVAHYDVRFDRTTAARRLLHVEARYPTAGRDSLLVSLPAWTPGAYELTWFARNVIGFIAKSAGEPLRWDKVDADTWRVRTAGASEVVLSFDYRADALDNAMSWSRDDFAFFNGTNIFPYVEGSTGPATVTVHTEVAWKVATGMRAAGPLAFTARDYDYLVDMPFFVGAFDLDSAEVAGKWVRLATYPAGKLVGGDRSTLWDQIKQMIPPMVAVFGEQPQERYTNLLIFDEGAEGGSALEHANSHLGIYSPFMVGDPALASITAHEIFHLWNVKRMRPAELWPYRYDRAQPTPLLWVSEGITDYYADLALLRGGVIDSTDLLAVTHGKMQEVDAAPAVSLEDASLSTWIQPIDGTAYLYYPKGSLAGLLLDILIRDATGNASSLDDVMREVYQGSWKRGRGFTDAEWWSAVERSAGGRSFAQFRARYIDGRDPLPYGETLALAGIQLHVDSLREPRIGAYTEFDSSGVRVTAMDPGSAIELAGVQIGDYLLVVGGVPVSEGFAERFRARHARNDGSVVTVKVRRGSDELTLPMRIQMAVRTNGRLVFDAGATPRALRLRTGWLTGRRGG
jgi:predicted metalloprotease with PDZ domain